MTTRKLDLLHDCNDQRIPVKDFKATFCNRCRNNQCVNSGWATSTWEGRISTQVERLFNPLQDTGDSKFDPIRAMHFKEVVEAIVLRRRADPWSGPGVHLAEPSPDTATSQTVEDAVSRLAEARGKKANVSGIEVQQETPLDQNPDPVVVSPVVVAPLVQPPRVVLTEAPSVAVATSKVSRTNTEFPDEGVMIGGAPVQTGAPQVGPTAVDPWETKKKPNIVPRGAKIRME